MTLLTASLSLAGLAGVCFMLCVFASLSARLGAVTRTPPRHRLFWVGAACVALSASVRTTIIFGLADNRSATTNLLIYYLPLCAGISVSLYAVWFYWRWLVRE